MLPPKIQMENQLDWLEVYLTDDNSVYTYIYISLYLECMGIYRSILTASVVSGASSHTHYIKTSWWRFIRMLDRFCDVGPVADPNFELRGLELFQIICLEDTAEPDALIN